MEVWRICQRKYANTPFSGEGELYVQGRWHPKGYKIIYTSSTLALASLEMFVNLESDKIPLVAIRAFIDENIPISEVLPSHLPDN